MLGIVEDTDDPQKPRIGDAWYFRLPREFDRTGTFKLGFDVQLGRYRDDARRERLAAGRARRAEAGRPLKPDTPYVVRLGTLTLDDPLPDEANLPDWQLRDRLPDIDKIKGELLGLPAAASEARFRTFPVATRIVEKMSFLLGSCRYPANVLTIFTPSRPTKSMAACSSIRRRRPLGTARSVHDDVRGSDYADQAQMFPIGKADTYREFRIRTMKHLARRT